MPRRAATDWEAGFTLPSLGTVQEGRSLTLSSCWREAIGASRSSVQILRVSLCASVVKLSVATELLIFSPPARRPRRVRELATPGREFAVVFTLRVIT